MNKILRYSLLAVLAIVAHLSFAQTEFDFDTNGVALLGVTGESSNESTAGDITEAKTATIGDISVTVSAAAEGAKNPNRLWLSAAKLRMYSGTLTISSKGDNIKSIVITAKKWNTGNTASVGTLDNSTWTGDAKEVVINIAGNTQIDKITVSCKSSEDPEPASEATKVTVAEFNAAAESTDVWYELTGTVTNLKDGDQYGNFDLVDETGSVYVYGVLSEKGGEKKQFQTLATEKGIVNGSKITIIGNRGSYKDKIEVLNAYFVSVDNSGVTPEPDPEPASEATKATVAEFNAAAESTEVWYQLTGTVTNLKDGDQYGNFDLVDETGSVYVYGVLSEKGGEKKQFQALATEKGIVNGSKITIIGNRGSYKDKIEVLNAYFVSVDNSGVTPEPDPEPASEATKATVAEFNAAAESTEVWYQLTGTVSNLKDGDQYGNFDLVDETGSVYVYGVLSEKGGAKKQFQTLATEKGIVNGSKITIIGNRGSYKDKIEVLNAYFVSVENEASGINTIKANTNDNAPAYNLAGQKIADGFKGLVIKNGKKYMMK